MTDRRFSDDEFQRILARAAEVDAGSAAAHHGERQWTLAEIQRVGEEAGFSADAIAVAAASLDREGPALHDRRHLGLPVAVAHSIPLARALSESEWRRLVVECRDVFEAHGREQVNGARREWVNGNLVVSHEAIGAGAILEFRTRKSEARTRINFGVTTTIASASVVAGLMIASPADMTATLARLLAAALAGGLLGVGTLAASWLRLPSWAATREEQFMALAELARRLTASPGAPAPLLTPGPRAEELPHAGQLPNG